MQFFLGPVVLYLINHSVTSMSMLCALAMMSSDVERDVKCLLLGLWRYVGIGILFREGSAIVMHSVCGPATPSVAFESCSVCCLDGVLKKVCAYMV